MPGLAPDNPRAIKWRIATICCIAIWVLVENVVANDKIGLGPENTQERCADRIDNDEDKRIDCGDFDCSCFDFW